MEFSIISFYGKQTNRCGYCKGTQSSIADGMHAFNMTPQDYQDLIDRGWRRSGIYCYKPQNKSTCCPCYTIKCDALEIELSKSHKKILKRMNRFLRDGKNDMSEQEKVQSKDADTKNGGINCDDESGGGIGDEPKEPDVPICAVNFDAVAAANPKRYATAHVNNEHFDDMEKHKKEVATSLASLGSAGWDGSKKYIDGSNPPRKKAKQMRLERRQAKLAAKGIDTSTLATSSSTTTTNQTKPLSAYFSETSPLDKHKLKLEIVHVKSKQFSNTLQRTYALYQKYQTSIHSDPPENVKEYLEFLQRSPLKYTITHDGPSEGYGSFHQQYWLDDKLIAVGVIDILPYCVSSVYFFYDPDYSFLSLGTYGSLREIEFVQQLARRVPAIKYYYMGYYIHSCQKMRYKGKLTPSYLVCPETYSWNLLTEEMRSKLDQSKYQRLNSDLNATDADEFLENDLDLVLLLVDDNTCIRTYKEIIQITGDSDDRDLILEYGKLVGRNCAHRMLYLKS